MEIHKNEENTYADSADPGIIHNSRKLKLSNYDMRKYLRKGWLDIKHNVCDYEKHIYKDLFITRGNVYTMK